MRFLYPKDLFAAINHLSRFTDPDSSELQTGVSYHQNPRLRDPGQHDPSQVDLIILTAMEALLSCVTGSTDYSPACHH